ncbi:MAG: c-type cytochrome [Candidatus Puniceispirillaceae bacterium]
MISVFFATSGKISNSFASNIVAVDRGREIVRQHCTRCHVVPDMNPYGGIGSTPSFSAMKWLGDWARRFEIFYILPPHPSLVRIEGVSEERSASLPAFNKEIILKLEDIDDILEFVKTVKTPE